MNRTARRLIAFVLSLVMVLQWIPVHFQANPTAVWAVETTGKIKDILPMGLPLEFSRLGNRPKDDEYVRQYNRAVDAYNHAQYSDAIAILRKLILTYNDNRSSLYLWAVCMAEDFSNKTDYSKAIAYYKTALNIQRETFVEHNIAYCYQQLAERLKNTDRVAMLLYGYQLISKAHLRDDSLETIAVNLCNVVLNPPLVDYFSPAIDCIKTALEQKDNPYLHQTLGLIYLYQNNRSLAKTEFKAVVDDYPRSPFYANCLERYNNIGNARYRYQALYPIRVSANSRGAASLTAKIMLQIPQSYRYQTVRNLRVSLNSQEIGYQTVRDQFGTWFLRLEISKIFLPGTNRLIIESEVDNTENQMGKDSIAALRITDYRPEARYKLWTGSSQAIDLKNPQIQRMAAQIRQSVASDRLVDWVQAVYQYVMKAMSYQEILRSNQKVGVQRALGHMQSAVCEDYAMITVALLRSLGIPATYFSGDYYGSEVGHAWAVFFTPDYQPVPLDTTWGDTSQIPDLFFMSSGNSLITTSFSYDSSVMPDDSNTRFECSSNPGVSVAIGEEQLQLQKLSDGLTQ
ncbi:MAG TPA: hypothetical protein DDW50_13400 [Firmicutes bacterium]|jgi:transglutaminase-like putative cysteine protease|nr:hypothetical protein [Bacillota bacterium]